MVNSTDYTTPSQASTKFGVVNAARGVLLLEIGDRLLLEQTSGGLLLEATLSNTINYSSPTTVNSTNYS